MWLVVVLLERPANVRAAAERRGAPPLDESPDLGPLAVKETAL